MKKQFSVINLFCFTYLILSSFVLIFVFSRLLRDFHYKSDYYFRLLIFFIFITLFWFLVLFLKKNYKEIIIIIATSVLFGLYLSEIYFSINNFIKYKKNINSKFKTYKELRSERSSLAYSGIIENEPFFTMGGASNIKTILCNETGKWTVYKSDRYGFNNPDNEWDKPSSGYLIVGDSFAHGACVNEGEDMTSHIRDLSNIKAINLGFAGNGPLKNLATLKEYINLVKPEKVFWLHYEGNDLYNLKQEMNMKYLTNYLDPEYSQNLIYKQNNIDLGIKKKLIEYENLWEQWNDHSKFKFNKAKLIEILKLSDIRSILGLTAFWEAKVDINFESIMKKAKKQTELVNSDFYFVYLPSYVRLNQFFPKDNFFDKKNVIKKLNKLNIKIIDLEKEFFKKAKDPLIYFPNRRYGHYTSEAYRKIAENLLLITK